MSESRSCSYMCICHIQGCTQIYLSICIYHIQGCSQLCSSICIYITYRAAVTLVHLFVYMYMFRPQGCSQSCLQVELHKQCGCVNSLVVTRNFSRCSLTNKTQGQQKKHFNVCVRMIPDVKVIIWNHSDLKKTHYFIFDLCV